MLDKLEELGAEVERVGADWNEAHIMAEYEAKMDTGAFLVHPHAQVGGAILQPYAGGHVGGAAVKNCHFYNVNLVQNC